MKVSDDNVGVERGGGGELKEIREMVGRVTREMAKIREAQRQMRQEMCEVKGEVKKFKELWLKEKLQIESRLDKLEEGGGVRNELEQRLERFEEIGEAIEMREKRLTSEIGDDLMARADELRHCIVKNDEDNNNNNRNHYGSTVNIKYEKLRCPSSVESVGAANSGLKQKFFRRNIFRVGRTDL